MPLTRCLALLAAFGALANSLRSDNASALIRTLLRCSARPNGGGYLSARPLRELRPNGLFAALTSRGLGFPHSSLLTPHSSLLTPHSSLRPRAWKSGHAQSQFQPRHKSVFHAVAQAPVATHAYAQLAVPQMRCAQGLFGFGIQPAVNFGPCGLHPLTFGGYQSPNAKTDTCHREKWLSFGY